MIRYIKDANHIVPVSSPDMKGAIQEVVLKVLPRTSSEIQELLVSAAIQRENLCSTAVPGGIAFPRAEFEGANTILCAAGVSENGICFGQAGQPVKTFFLTLYPKSFFKEFVLLLENLVSFSQDPQKLALLRKVPIDRENFAVVRNAAVRGGTQDWLHAHLIVPFSSILNRAESTPGAHHHG